MTTPVVVSTWPTLLTTPSSEEGAFVIPRVGAVPAPTQRLSHALGGPAPPSRHMSVASSVTATLAKSSGHRHGNNKSPSPQCAKNKEPMETDNNVLGHLQHSLELDNVADDLPHSRFVLIDHNLVSKGDEMQEDWPHSSVAGTYLRGKLRSAAKTVVSWFAKGALPEEYLSHNFDEYCLEDTRLIWCLSYPSGGAPLIPGHYVSW